MQRQKDEARDCTIITVTNNSEKHLHKAMDCINRQTVRPTKVVLVDSGSHDLSYLAPYQKQSNVEVIIGEKGIGFCKGNNIGMAKVPAACDYVFFLNPDAFLTPTFLEYAAAFMEAPENARCGGLTSTVLGYDIQEDKPTGTYDTTGVFRTWYGKWYDRDQGSTYDKNRYKHMEKIPAICGAVFFCRKQALDQILVRQSEVFDNTFYMYKEDIDLSLRLRKKGWHLIFHPGITAYHCRGWQRDRSKMARKLRISSARNELRIHMRLKEPAPIAYSLLKYASVKLLDM
jgi:N-acetylglucosaminyl-diphospho-decaprenol L-rhamnosyltransferase